MYTNISDGISAQNKGGIIGTIVLGSSFADLLRDHTGLDIIIYNKDKFFSTSFFDKGKRLNFRNREDLYNKFVNKEITENFEIMKIDLSENNQFYKLYYTPIISVNEEVVGMIAYCIDIKPIENIKKNLFEEESLTSNKFEQIINEISDNLKHDEHKFKESFSLHLIIILIIFLIIFSIIFNIFIKAIIVKSINKVSTGLKELSEGRGKLGFLEVKSKDEIGELTEYFNVFVNNLNFVINEIKDGAMVIASSTMEINAGNKNLVEKAAEQSESIQNTFENINEIENIVKKNAGITTVVNGMTRNAKKIADEVTCSTKELQLQMTLIKDSSHQIEKILTVLDEITFQTNLLAINAAVESARAGELGKGFGVVASEIRNLAQRSQKASKQIKELIKDNVKKVESGDDSAKNTIADIERIVNEVKNIDNIIVSMASGTEKQNNDIEKAVYEVEKIKNMTESNEEIIKTIFGMTEILNEKAFEFQDLVNFFVAEKKHRNTSVKEKKAKKKRWLFFKGE